MSSRQTYYCRQCGYDLQGLPEPRCPECGQPFDPNDPRTFQRGPKMSLWAFVMRPFRSRLVRALGILLIGFVLAEIFVDAGRIQQCCHVCSARSQVKYFYIFGLGGRYGRVTTEGPISRFIQNQDKYACQHQWQTRSATGGAILFRWEGVGRGFLPWINTIEGSDLDLLNYLESRAESDPGFVDQLKAAIQQNDLPQSDKFLENLFHDVIGDAEGYHEDREETGSRRPARLD